MNELKIALIFPKLIESIHRIYSNFWLTDLVKYILNLGTSNHTPPLSLLMLAAVTPPDVNLVIIDERLETINYDMDVDLVGLSVMTRTAYHAYDISDQFRKRGIKVVMGGIHPSVLPREALLHADSVIMNEGETAWQQLIKDFKEGKLKKIYKGGKDASIDNLPNPRRELLRYPKQYLTTKVITATRGCGNSCTFCTIGSALGKKYRTRNISNIIQEIEKIPGRYLLFFDDNLGVDIEFTKKLFKALKPLKLVWGGAISIPALEDEELIKFASDSGCISLGVGFESLSKKTLKLMGKVRTNNPDRYSLLINRLHNYGISIIGYFLLGYDSDTPKTYIQLANFIEETSIEIPWVNVLIPYPGTPIYRQLEYEGRILCKNWNLYDTAGGYVVYKPKNMTPEELFINYLHLAERLYSKKSVFKRLINTGHFKFIPFLWSLHYNYQRQRSVAIERITYERNKEKSDGS